MARFANFDKIKYEFEEENIVPGYYTIHRPCQCNLKFPKDNRPIHKKLQNVYEGKTTIVIPQNGKLRKMIVPSCEKTIYPEIWHQNQYENIKQQAIRKEDPTTIAMKIEKEAKKKALGCEERKQLLESKFKPQPGKNITVGIERNSEKKNNIGKLIKRSEGMRNEEFQGARIANQIIMAAKCHAIRDQQVKEKIVIDKEIEDENKRLDIMMEEARLALLEEEQKKNDQRKKHRLETTNNIKIQIMQNEKSKLIELERIQKESAKTNQDNTLLKQSEIEKLRKKRENAIHLKAFLDKANEEIRYLKQKEMENSKHMEERIKAFMQQRQEREARLRAEAEAKKAAKAKNVNLIATAQLEEQRLRKELENLRILKIQEDVEREYRAKEKSAAIKKRNDIEKLKEAREKQIADIRRQMAMEIAKEEEIVQNILKYNEEDRIKQLDLQQKKQDKLQDFKRSTIDQVNDNAQRSKEKSRKEHLEDNAFIISLKQRDEKERDVIREKISQMRMQNIPEKYVREVEQRLAKLKYY